MNSEPAEEQPQEPADWPPPRASRAIRRHCQHVVKPGYPGYCAFCGEKQP